MARLVSGLRSLWIAVGASIAGVCVVSAQAPDARARFTGTWQRDAVRTVEDRADWQRLDATVRRPVPCVDVPVRQEDWAVRRYERDCYIERIENNRRDSWRIPRLPTTDLLAPRLGGRLMTFQAELRTESTATVAVVAGAPDPEAMTFSTAGATTTVPFGERTVRVNSSWRNGELVQVLSGKDDGIDFRVRRTFATSADGRTLTVTSRVEKPRLKPPVKDSVHVFTRSR